MPPMKMTHADNFKEDLLASLGDLNEIEVFNNNILVAIYIRPNKTKSGIILADETTEQDKYQGKIGLVVK